MAKDKPVVIPDAWTHAKHRELQTHGIGEGFALFEAPGESMRGVLRTFFPTRHGRAVAMQLSELPDVRIFRTRDDGERDELSPLKGDLVNVSLSGVDLDRKIGKDLQDCEIGIQYDHTITTKAGAMKVFRVVVFQDELPF